MFGTWRVVDEPVRIGVECAACGAPRRIRLDRLRGPAPGPCQRCGAGATRQDRRGASATHLYRAWRAMIRRCSPHAAPQDRVAYYDRGIRVCEEWLTSWEAYQAWAHASGYAEGLTIERDDVDGNYTPDNCRWVPPAVQAINRRHTVWVTAFGERRQLVEWVADPRCVVDYYVAYDRIKDGWEPELALTKPKRRRTDNRPDAVRTKKPPR